MSTGERAVTLCGWGVKAGMASLQVELCVAIYERFGKCYSISRHFIQMSGFTLLFYFYLGIEIMDLGGP